MTGPRALFAGPGACRALSPNGAGEVVLALSGGAYVRLGSSDWILVTGPSAPFGPLSLAVDGLERLDPRPGAPARVTRGRLDLGGQAVSLERMRERLPIAMGSPSPATDRSAIKAAAASAATELPTPPAQLRPGLTALAGVRERDAVRLLAGLGDGLTPAGDDVLAGYAAARLALGVPVALSPAAAGRSSALGLAYLRCAERGELPDVCARLLAAICGGSTAAARAALAPLAAWGSSSGAALAWGINAAVMKSNERSYRWQDSGWGSTCSRTRRSSISLRPTASGRWHADMTRSSTRS